MRENKEPIGRPRQTRLYALRDYKKPIEKKNQKASLTSEAFFILLNSKQIYAN
jgi:hypothetical protein